MNRRWLMAALAFPIITLIASALDAWRQSVTATTWVLPIEGYDPRDLIRGHYVVFQYNLDPIPSFVLESSEDWRLCLAGDVAAPRASFLDLRKNQAGDCSALARPIDGHDGFRKARRSGEAGARIIGTLYIPETDGPKLDALLADNKRRHAVKVQVAQNGKTTPIDILIDGRPYKDILADQ